MVARERASEGCFAAWRRRSLPCTLVYVSQLHARSRPHHRARAEATEYTIIALPEEKPVDTNKTGDMHISTQIVLYVSGRVVHSAISDSYTASRHLRLGGRDLTENIMKWFSLHPRGDSSGFHRETLLLGVDYDTVLTTPVIHKKKTNELTDNITDGVKRLRFGPCQPSCCGTSGCVSLTAACTRWQCGVSSFMACGLGQALMCARSLNPTIDRYTVGRC